MIAPAAFVDHLLARGFDFFTGVPCSLVKGVLAELNARGLFVVENREDAALGLAAGAYLAGRRPVVIMQNSGVGVALNAMGSLHRIYALPALLVVTWRGYGGKDAPEHLVMGAALPGVLTSAGVPFRELEAARVCESVDWAAAELAARPGPVALLSPPQVLS